MNLAYREADGSWSAGDTGGGGFTDRTLRDLRPTRHHGASSTRSIPRGGHAAGDGPGGSCPAPGGLCWDRENTHRSRGVTRGDAGRGALLVLLVRSHEPGGSSGVTEVPPVAKADALAQLGEYDAANVQVVVAGGTSLTTWKREEPGWSKWP